MSQPVGIFTGGASGIGLAVTKHLLSRGYKVLPTYISSHVLFRARGLAWPE